MSIAAGRFASRAIQPVLGGQRWLKCGSRDRTRVATRVSSCHSSNVFPLKRTRKPWLSRRPRSGLVDGAANDSRQAVHRGRYTLLPARRRHVGLRRVCPKNRERYNSTVLPLSDALVSNMPEHGSSRDRPACTSLSQGPTESAAQAPRLRTALWIRGPWSALLAFTTALPSWVWLCPTSGEWAGLGWRLTGLSHPRIVAPLPRAADRSHPRSLDPRLKRCY